MAHRIAALLSISAFLVTGAAHAAERENAAASTQAIAPFVDANTVAVVHIDASKMDPGQAIEIVSRLAGFSREEIAARQALIGTWRAEFLKKGGRDLFVVWSLDDIHEFRAPFLVVPVAGDRQAGLGEFLRQTGYGPAEAVGSTVIWGRQQTVERLRKMATEEPPSWLTEAFRETERGQARVVLRFPERYRELLGYWISTFIDPIQKNPGESDLEDVRWLAVGIDVPPAPRLQVLVRARDRAGLQRLKGTAQKLFETLRSGDEGKPLAPNAEELVESLTPAERGDQLEVVLTEQNKGIPRLWTALTPALQQARRAGLRTQTLASHRQLGAAIGVHHDKHGHFPAAWSASRTGRKLLSWRVHLLPFLGQEELYRQFQLNEAWDSPHNKALIEKMPAVYSTPEIAGLKPGMTTFVAPVGRGTVFGGGRLTRSTDITDGTSSTLLLLHADKAHAVIWTKPEDLMIDFKNPLNGLHFDENGQTAVCYADGSVQYLKRGLKPAIVRALLTINAGDSTTDAVLGRD